MHAVTTLALFDIGGPELMLILVVVLLLFGAKRLPEMARNVGRSMEEFKRAARNVREEVMNADQEPPRRTTTAALPEPAPTTDNPESTASATESAVESKAEVTLDVSTTPPQGTVSQSDVQDDQTQKNG